MSIKSEPLLVSRQIVVSLACVSIKPVFVRYKKFEYKVIIFYTIIKILLVRYSTYDVTFYAQVRHW